MSHCPLCLHRDVTLVSFDANLHSDDRSRDAAVCTDKPFLPRVVLSRNSSVDSMLAFGPGDPGSIPGIDIFFFGKFFFIYFFFNDGKIIDTNPYDMSSTQIYQCSNSYF